MSTKPIWVRATDRDKFTTSSFDRQNFLDITTIKGKTIQAVSEATDFRNIYSMLRQHEMSMQRGGKFGDFKLLCTSCNNGFTFRESGELHIVGTCVCPFRPPPAAETLQHPIYTRVEDAYAALVRHLFFSCNTSICATYGSPPPNWEGPIIRRSGTVYPRYCRELSGKYISITIKKVTRNKESKFAIINPPTNQIQVQHRLFGIQKHLSFPYPLIPPNEQHYTHLTIFTCMCCAEETNMVYYFNCSTEEPPCDFCMCFSCFNQFKNTRPNDKGFEYNFVVKHERKENNKCPGCRRQVSHYGPKNDISAPIQFTRYFLYHRPVNSIEEMNKLYPSFRQVEKICAEKASTYNEIRSIQLNLQQLHDELIGRLTRTTRRALLKQEKDLKRTINSLQDKLNHLEDTIPDFAKDKTARISVPLSLKPEIIEIDLEEKEDNAIELDSNREDFI